ncbi:L-threonylcarbamoyladenylate synthase [Simiduia agarivorans]|uniref:Threonylcarbamoyl-AMP synthase n=1 Tax=Simiduia agarivorans (strain DSM 21679 / JCM 13881 / BCRC 17597 / SA1) TaxID=1117647 RepID=K4KKT1_SIMAS|nr:L-threonylcarbamoyladenylate synthase [Simiduia agarivorans]AFU99631.1 translation factor [Simiduia agarivorans SA1 = DSM 21679]
MSNPWLQDPQLIAAAEAIKAGGVVAYPTEGVWGLGCLPEDTQAVNRILDMKGRSPEKGLILVAANLNQVSPWLDTLSSREMAQLRESWPGPNTWLVPHQGKVPVLVTGIHDKVAIRVSAHPVVQALCELCGSALVSTSANPQGAPAAVNEQEVRAYFGASLDALAPGEVQTPGKASRIRDLETGAEIRP